MKKLMEFLSQEGVSRKLLDRVTEYRKTYDVMEIPEETSRRIRSRRFAIMGQASGRRR